MGELEKPELVAFSYLKAMNDNTSWTPSSEDNLLGFTDKALINEYEAKGIAKAELFIFTLDENVEISVPLLL
ncbi:hypothetical protein [Rufibacter sp. LB8]|uniref:hypothetical protein n=1 Tax=Rufibacter sp. LB8 TaxID=2777781 RepID=UPI00178C7A3D|nr:hypothetical protein [Rufibacter sp. LB8]